MRSPALALACAAALSAPPASADPPAAAPQSPGLLAGGVVLSVAGGAAMTLGIVRIASIEACPGTCSKPQANETIGAVVLGVGAAALAGGIVMAVVGGRRVPPAAAAWIGAPGGAGWTFRF